MSRFKYSWGKAKILLSQLLCIGAVFTACTDDEIINQTTKALQVSVSTEAPAESRAIIDGGYLPDGASIGVTLTAEDGTAYDGQAFTNLQYTAAGEGSAQTWSSATPASLSITTSKVIAYYPYYGGDDFDLKAVPVETASQTDYMYAKPVTGINMVSPAANLTMQHAMTDIRINVKKGTYTGTGEVTKITAKAPAFATTATMDVETGVFANVSGGGAQFVQELAGAAISSGNVVHDFLIVPDAKSTSGDVSIFVIIDGKKFAVNVPYTEAFQQGFAYTYNLTLDNAALTLDGVSVSKWGVKAEVDESLQFYDDQYIVEIQVPSDNYEYIHNIDGFVGTIDWGDGTNITYTESINMPSHTYTTAGNYTVIAEGRMSALSSSNITINGVTKVRSKVITKLVRIGKEMGVTSMDYAFSGQTLLTEIVPGALDGCTMVKDFSGAFRECISLQSIPKGLFDKCTEVTSFGYNSSATYHTGMFENCSSLIHIPEGLFDKCTKVTTFGGTFEGCTKLQTIPKGLFDSCTKVTNFFRTFYGCKSLQEIPEGLFDYNTEVPSFYNTFYGCRSLTSIPEGLFDKCTEVTNFQQTFYGCASLTAIPSGLFDYNTKLPKFNFTFGECGKLQTIPNGLFDKCTEVTSFIGTFYRCYNLTTIPEGLFDNNTKVLEFLDTFRECSSLKIIPEGLFDKCTVVKDFSGAFRESGIVEVPARTFGTEVEQVNFTNLFTDCSYLSIIKNNAFNCPNLTSLANIFKNLSNLTTIEENAFNCPNILNYKDTFWGSGITAIPEGLFNKCTKVTSFEGTFGYCYKLQAIPEGLFDACTEVTNFSGAFYWCYNLQTIPEGLFDKCTEVTNFERTFSRCTKLQTIPVELFDNNTKVTSFADTFGECDALTSIPAGLFDKCTGVTSFAGTFSGCTKITSESPYTLIKVDGVDTKVHLYERANYPEYFTATPTSFSSCFYNSSKLIDYSSIPTEWK